MSAPTFTIAAAAMDDGRVLVTLGEREHAMSIGDASDLARKVKRAVDAAAVIAIAPFLRGQP